MISDGIIVDSTDQEIKGPFHEGMKAFWMSADPEMAKRMTRIEVEYITGVWHSRDSVRIMGRTW